jgi:hypothetical protein
MFRIKANTDVSLNITSQLWTKSNSNLIYDNGNIGIGTNVPMNRLHIVGSCGIGTEFSTSNIQSNSLVVSGNVGIGTYYTNSKLDVSGNILITDTNPGLIIGDKLNITSSTIKNELFSLQLQNTTISSTGNVGIGTNNPRTLLDVSGSMYAPGHVVQVQTVQTSVQNTYAAATGNVLTIVTPLNIVITPKKSNSKIMVQWMLNGEIHQDTLFVVMKNSTAVGFNTTSGNVYTSGTVAGLYDTNENSTPGNFKIFWIDNNVGNTTPQTYSIGVKSTQSAVAYTLYLNRCVNSAGGDEYEALVSNGVAFEIAT